MSVSTKLRFPVVAGAVGVAAMVGIALWNVPTHAATIALPASGSLSLQAANGPAAHVLKTAPDELQEPTLFQSQKGVLDVLMVAHEAPVPMFFPFRSSGWVYEICPTPTDGSERCPKGTSSSNEYGGTRLQVEPGDTLRIRLVNLLPLFTLPVDPHAVRNPGGQVNPAPAHGRSQNPTSLHTHGLLVSPHAALPGQMTWGDNPFARVFNLANGRAPDFEKMMGPVLYDHIQYEYDIPTTHPSGLFWFHPHAHGLTQAQITSGMSGVLTIGHVADEVCGGAACQEVLAQVPQRHLLLKDAQIGSDNTLSLDQDTGFCAVDKTPGSTSRQHEGGCDGTASSPVSGMDHTGGRWFYSINGQVYPTITVGMPSGQVWRITNASANATYNLNLWLPGEQRQMQMQVLSVDGVTVATSQPGTNQLTSCLSPFGAGGVCTTRLHLMPASRAEIWVSYRDAQGFPRLQPKPVEAILRTSGYATGPTGDNFPAIDLAKLNIQTGDVPIKGDGTVSPHRTAVANPVDWNATASSMARGPSCGPLAAGHMRRIFLNMPEHQAIGARFGLGYEEIDEHGHPVPGTFVDVRSFDHMDTPLCLSLAPGNNRMVERWQLVNIAAEDHSFHIHQVRFAVISAPGVDDSIAPQRIGVKLSLIDSLPLPHADGQCDSVAAWRHGACKAHVATVEIPFTIAGDYLFHCHVLEHEDGGMMAAIRVLANP